MDYLDLKKQRRHSEIMLTGYVFIAIAIIIATYLLVNQAYGYDIGQNGTVIEEGALFLSSQPHPANIYIDGKLNSDKTNARLLLPADIYQLKLTRTGYRSWQRTIALDGGKVEHFDYPLLFPTKLATTKLASFTSAPALTTQSPDRHWLVVLQPGSDDSFDVYDMTNPTKAPSVVSLPAGIASKATTSETWQLVSWADDNLHVLLKHVYDGNAEYILLDRSDASQAINLTTTLKVNPLQLQLDNKKYNQYFLLNADHSLSTVSMSDTTPTTLVSDVLAYQTYGSNSVLYVTADDAPAGKVLVKLFSNNQTYILHTLPLSSNYLVNLTTYSGTLYVAVGAAVENKIYIYRDPIGQLSAAPNQAVSPIQVLHVTNPTYLSFSDNAQFIVAEGGNQFGVYDIENEQGYNYRTTQPLDAPQINASWMDGDRLTYVSQGKLLVFDYDDTNVQSLMPASPNYLAAYSPDYSYIYSLSVPETTGTTDLDQTSLLVNP